MLRTTFLVPSAVAQAVQASQDYSWTAHIAAGNGTYDGQRRRIISGVGNVSFWLIWDATNTLWQPDGDQLFNSVVGQTVTTSDGTQTITFAPVAMPAAFLRSGLGIRHEIIAETSISAAARTLQLTVGTSDYTNLPAAANRRVAGRFGFIATSTTAGVTITKKDAAEYDFAGGANTNLSSVAETWAGAINLTGSVSFSTAASSATATVRRNKLFLVRS